MKLEYLDKIKQSNIESTLYENYTFPDKTMIKIWKIMKYTITKMGIHMFAFLLTLLKTRRGRPR